MVQINKKRVTLRAVAERTGYSLNTISRALKNMDIVAPSTSAEIRKVAMELGYVPNQAARMLRSGHTRAIALIVGSLLNPFFAMIFEYVRQAAEKSGYTIMLFSANENDAREQASIQAAMEYGVEGIILVPCQQSDACIPLLEHSGIPFVLLCRDFEGRNVNYVGCDELTAGRLAARHLQEAGHERLIYLKDSGFVAGIEQRRHGFLEVAEQHGPVYQIPAAALDSHLEQREAVAREILQLHRENGYTGIAAYCDAVARTAILALREKDPQAAASLGFIGFDDIDSIAPSPLPICSVRADYGAMCRRAVEMILDKVNLNGDSPERAVFPVEVCCRNSCRID